MTEISAKSVSDVHGIIQNYEIENNSKFRVVKKDVNFGNDGKGIASFGNLMNSPFSEIYYFR